MYSLRDLYKFVDDKRVDGLRSKSIQFCNTANSNGVLSFTVLTLFVLRESWRHTPGREDRKRSQSAFLTNALKNMPIPSAKSIGLIALSIEAAENTVHPLPERVYTHIHSFMSKSKAFRGSTLEDTRNWVDRYDKWEAPKELQEKFPYYQSGFDKENRPVWVGEIGKYGIRRQVEKGPEAAADLEKYLLQASLRIGKSMLLRDTPEKPVRQVFFIGDWEDQDIAEFAHLPTLNFVLTLMRTYVDILTEAWGYCAAINVNSAAKRGFELTRPIIGGVLDKMDVYGEDKEKWMAGLKKYMPEEAIPTWYGGRPDFKPLAIYG